MFFIFGWNHPQVTDYGSVQQEKCQNCHNTDIWQLKKISKYFTLFFIPVFPHDTEYLYHCPICNQGLKPDRKDFESYKTIAAINTACLEKQITEEERLKQLDVVYKQMQERKIQADIRDTEESKKWTTLVAEKPSEELQMILDGKRGEYNPGFMIAARNELEKRKQ